MLRCALGIIVNISYSNQNKKVTNSAKGSYRLTFLQSLSLGDLIESSYRTFM